MYATLDPEMHEQMFRSGVQSDTKPPVLSSHSLICQHQNKLDVGNGLTHDSRSGPYGPPGVYVSEKNNLGVHEV
ncbi:hypothetical protein TNCV_2672841 [Trichonephila clavipes]|nr:hypothetical protein TNCV_2672841 [Trichonephila clavipes]